MEGKTSNRDLAAQTRSNFNTLVRQGFDASERYRAMADDAARRSKRGLAAFFQERGKEHQARAVESMRLVRSEDWTMELSFEQSPDPDYRWGDAATTMLEAKVLELKVREAVHYRGT